MKRGRTPWQEKREGGRNRVGERDDMNSQLYIWLYLYIPLCTKQSHR